MPERHGLRSSKKLKVTTELYELKTFVKCHSIYRVALSLAFVNFQLPGCLGI